MGYKKFTAFFIEIILIFLNYTKQKHSKTKGELNSLNFFTDSPISYIFVEFCYFLLLLTDGIINFVKQKHSKAHRRNILI